MKANSLIRQMLSAAVLAALPATRVVLADGGFVVEGVKGHAGEHLEVDLWMQGFVSWEVDAATTKDCWCPHPRQPGSTVYRYIFVPCPMLYCYFAYDSGGKVIMMSPAYE